MKRPVLSDFAVSNGLTAEETGCHNVEPSLTRQEFAEECDINVIMERYEATGVISHVSPRVPMYVDWSEQPATLMDALDIVMKADEAFMTLPAKVRREFDNDPLKFIDFAERPENLDRLRELGLAPPAEAPVAPAPPVVPQAAPVPPVEPPKPE